MRLDQLTPLPRPQTEATPLASPVPARATAAPARPCPYCFGRATRTRCRPALRCRRRFQAFAAQACLIPRRSAGGLLASAGRRQAGPRQSQRPGTEACCPCATRLRSAAPGLVRCGSAGLRAADRGAVGRWHRPAAGRWTAPGLLAAGGGSWAGCRW